MISRPALGFLVLFSSIGLSACAGGRQSTAAPAVTVPQAPAAAQAPRFASADLVLADPALLREHGDAAVAARNFDFAYRYFALIHALHPDGSEDRAAFPWAATIFKRKYEEHRHVRTDSPWHTSEPLFVFEWLESLGDEEFPDEEATVLFKGAPYEIGRRFIEFARTRPKLSKWRFEIIDDNGRLVEMRAVPVK